jgi:hypothetical protein
MAAGDIPRPERSNDVTDDLSTIITDPLARESAPRNPNLLKTESTAAAPAFTPETVRAAITAAADHAEPARVRGTAQPNRQTTRGKPGEALDLTLSEFGQRIESYSQNVIPKHHGEIIYLARTSGGWTDEATLEVWGVLLDSDKSGDFSRLKAVCEAAGAGIVIQRRTVYRTVVVDGVPMVVATSKFHAYLTFAAVDGAAPMTRPEDGWKGNPKNVYTDMMKAVIRAFGIIADVTFDEAPAGHCSGLAYTYTDLPPDGSPDTEFKVEVETIVADGRALDLGKFLAGIGYESPAAEPERARAITRSTDRARAEALSFEEVQAYVKRAVERTGFTVPPDGSWNYEQKRDDMTELVRATFEEAGAEATGIGHDELHDAIFEITGPRMHIADGAGLLDSAIRNAFADAKPEQVEQEVNERARFRETLFKNLRMAPAANDSDAVGAPESQAAKIYRLLRDNTETLTGSPGPIQLNVRTGDIHIGKKIDLAENVVPVIQRNVGRVPAALVFKKTEGRFVAPTWPKDMTFDQLVSLARENEFDPVLDYLNGLAPWDGTDRIPQLAGAFKIKEPRPVYETFLRKTMIAAVARARQPGCKHDTMLVLQAFRGGEKKSTSLARLFGDEFFADDRFDVDAKDSLLAINRSWVIEWAEMGALKRAKERETIKALISRRVDSYRSPYGRTIASHPRRSVFVGTTNPASILEDDGGLRRFWIISDVGATGDIDLDTISAIRDQLWAQAVAAFKAGEKWWLEGDEVEQHEDALQEGTHVKEEIGTETIMDAVRGKERVTVEGLLRTNEFLRPPHFVKGAAGVSTILKNLGWRQDRKRQREIEDGKLVRRRWWYPPAAAETGPFGDGANVIEMPRKGAA